MPHANGILEEHALPLRLARYSQSTARAPLPRGLIRLHSINSDTNGLYGYTQLASYCTASTDIYIIPANIPTRLLLAHVIIHELLHTFGIEHSGRPNELMSQAVQPSGCQVLPLDDISKERVLEYARRRPECFSEGKAPPVAHSMCITSKQLFALAATLTPYLFFSIILDYYNIQ